MDLARLLPNTFCTRISAHSATEVWPVISNPLLLPDLSTELQAVRLVDEGPVGLGSVFLGDQLRMEGSGERRWTTTSTVTGFVEGALFEWTVGELDRPVSRWSFLLDETAGKTSLTHRVVLCGGPSPLTDFITAYPETAEEVVQDRLDSLRVRMADTVEGLLALLDR